jgi:NADPH:quinone reductase-like Zn-dependent oxidoreductase
MAGARTSWIWGRSCASGWVVRGTVLRARPLEEKIAVTQAFARHLVPLFERGVLRPVVDRVLPLSAAAEAHAYLASNAGFGKVVLEVP